MNNFLPRVSELTLRDMSYLNWKKNSWGSLEYLIRIFISLWKYKTSKMVLYVQLWGDIGAHLEPAGGIIPSDLATPRDCLSRSTWSTCWGEGCLVYLSAADLDWSGRKWMDVLILSHDQIVCFVKYSISVLDVLLFLFFFSHFVWTRLDCSCVKLYVNVKVWSN